MDAICLASQAWVAHREKSESLISRIAVSQHPMPNTFHIDLPAVLRESEVQDIGLSNALVIPFSEWIRDGFTEDGVLDIETVRRAPFEFPPGGIIVLDATGHKSDIVVAALHQTRLALYPMQDWPALFVLVIDDVQMFQVSPILAATFRILPNVQAIGAIKRETRQFMDYAGMLRLFGRNVGVVAKALRWLASRGNRTRERRVNRGLGWTWEE